MAVPLRFEGIEDARELFGVVFSELGEFTYTDEVGACDSVGVSSSDRIGSRPPG